MLYQLDLPNNTIYLTETIKDWLKQYFPYRESPCKQSTTIMLFKTKLRFYTWKATLHRNKGKIDQYKDGWVDIGTNFVHKISIDTDTKVLLINDWMAFQLG